MGTLEEACNLPDGYRLNVASIGLFHRARVRGDHSIFPSSPFHADEISLKRGLMNRPGPGQERF
jgi:hypothetical protein